MNTRFAVATHILCLLESQSGEPTSSEWIAGSVGTNAALIRRLLGQLAQAGLTTSVLGKGGGALLAREASRITLTDVYHAVADDSDLVSMHASPNPACPVGANIQASLQRRVQAAELAFERELERCTIAHLTREIRSRSVG